uniref:COA8 family protein CG14806, mitochondrial n=1 Tax=Angiostrongylus cantonensis TaxID=6313 RepID=A0A158P6U6_ANGCA
MCIHDDQIRMDRRYDWVGPPHPVSKIRPIKLRRVDNESDLERQYREAREELNRWNSAFWAKHNSLFDTKKARFVEQRKKELGRIEQISANDLSVFYKQFLDSQYTSMMAYNKLVASICYIFNLPHNI